MLLKLQFDVDSDIIDVPKCVINNIEEYQTKFLSWLFDISTDHSYWFYKDGKKYGCCYRSDAFVEWLNKNPLRDSEDKATVILKFIRKYNKEIPTIYF